MCRPKGARREAPAARTAILNSRPLYRSPAPSLGAHELPSTGRSVRFGWVFVALLVVLAARSARAQHPLITLPLDDPAYEQLGLLERAGCSAGRPSAFRPYFVEDVRSALRGATGDPACPALVLDALQERFGVRPPAPKAIDTLAPVPAYPIDSSSASTSRIEPTDSSSGLTAGAMLTLRGTALSGGEFHPLWRDLRPTDEGDPPLVAIARGRLRYSGGPRFVAVSELYAQSDRRNDPSVRAKTLRRSSGFLDVGETYLNGRLGPVVASLGRSQEAWLGEGRESLVLSAHGPLLDRVMLAGRWRTVQARAIAAMLDPVTLTEAQDNLAIGTGPARFTRALVGHALTWAPVRAVELTLGETMLFARRGSVLDLGYLNPLAPLIVVQNDTGRTDSAARDNLMVFGGARFIVGPVTLESELLVDDIQVDAADRQRTTNQLGWRFRGTMVLPTLLPTVATLRYRRLDGFTYSRNFYSDVYQYYGAPLGSELGPDADRLDAELEHWPNGVLQLAAGVSLWRHGATRIDRRPAEGPNFTTEFGFPSIRLDRPAVQRAWIWHLTARLLTGHLPLLASVEAANITNLNNQPSAAASYVRVVLQGSYAIRFP